jgi:hypothetical protein
LFLLLLLLLLLLCLLSITEAEICFHAAVWICLWLPTQPELDALGPSVFDTVEQPWHTKSTKSTL